MDYLYENLGDERFQEFCNCLVSREFPNIQVFPVGQPDGGRDSLVYYMNSIEKEFIVFQVKFVRNANQEKDIHKWLTKTIESEVEKINKLIPVGAKKYYLLTNVRGTGHLHTGSKDSINKILEQKIKIPSICWWREDLSTLFEKDPIFKWSFPEILHGQDILNSILFEYINDNKERRESVIKAYLVDQFEIDNEVKFKQVDLQNKLFNLFIDVPIKAKKFNEKNKSLRQLLHTLDYQRMQPSFNEEMFFAEERDNMGAVEFLLHPKVQSGIERVLLEGGPGQGKSTISQYVCQVHRTRLLNKISDIELIPNKIKHTPIRLPFKIDLRDIAAWVEKKNPYQGILSEDFFNNIWRNSLEAFLVGHIFFHSKLEEFTSTDFISICKLSPILFVFDGFDEIANMQVRSEVIEFINKGITRISANSKSIQVIITSRPAAFSDSVGFSIDNYPHFELTDITTPIINNYVEKWIKASKLEERDAKDLRKLMKDKLEMPHLKGLAKSPMQLAIFISLLRTKGQSLPNKRTALYDNYIELIFDREAEKNSLIRDKRDLIIDIHQYLAWVLHSEAELYKGSGSIHIDDLNTRLKKYLNKEGHDVSITDELFGVMKERVCALISRVQGTFEFEVQPLREYFCAKYLYKSAPHSSAGSVKQGTKPDRLHAILRNFYWQNVVRFFAGCADAGELDMIIQELKDLQKDPILKYTNYPRIITSQILSDYVFTQKPLKLRDVVNIIVDGINIGNIINQDAKYSSNEKIFLPNECGRKEIVKECFEQLTKFPRNDYADELINIIKNNPLNNLELWLDSIDKFKGKQLTQWLIYSQKLELIDKVDQKILIKIIKEGDDTQIKRRLQRIISSNRIEIIDNNIELKKIVLDGILNTRMYMFQRNDISHSLKFLTHVLHPGFILRIFDNESNKTLINHINTSFERRQPHLSNSLKLISDFTIKDEIDRAILGFSNSIKILFNEPLVKFKTEIALWDILVENGRNILGDNWVFKVIATMTGGIKSKDELNDNYSDLNDSSLSLCKRVRYARMKSGNIKYWESQLEKSTDKIFTLLVLFTWVTPKTIMQLLQLLSKTVKSLEKNDFTTLIQVLSYPTNISAFNKLQQEYIENEMKNKRNYNEINYIISLRFNNANRKKYVYNNIKKYTGVMETVVDSKLQYLISLFLNDTSNISVLNDIKKTYKKANQHTTRFFHNHSNQLIKIPYETAKIIMQDCKNYPKIISSFAENSCRLYANQHIKPVGETANKEKWFKES